MNIFVTIWSQLQNYFRDWLKDTGGIGAYTTFKIDLSEAHNEKRYTFSGDQIVIAKSDSIAYIKLNDTRNENIDTTVINQINTPFNEFYITNEATVGVLEILVGSEGIFNSYPARINAIITDPTDAMGNITRIGNAELAARLGFLYSYDRRGNVKWFDDMQGTVDSWTFVSFGGGTGSCSLTDYLPFIGDQAFLLKTSAVAGSNVELTRIMDPGFDPRIGFECLAATRANDGYFTLCMSCQGKSGYGYGELKLDIKNDKIYLMPGSGEAFIEIADHDFFDWNASYMHIKLVGDFSAKKWVRCIINGIEYDLSSHDWVHTTAPSYSKAMVSFRVGNIDAEVVQMVVGGCVFTDNEP